MTRVITKEVFAEAVTLGRELLPKLTAIELAQILGISVVHTLRCLASNKDHVQLDAEKNVIGFAQGGIEMTMSTVELWAWHVKNNAGGDESKALAAKSQTDLTKMVTGKITFVKPFEFVVCSYLTEEREGGNVKNMVGTKYGNDLASLVALVAEVKGQGTVIDKYLYAIVLDVNSAPFIRTAGLHPFVAERVMNQMSKSRGWTDYEVPVESHEWSRATINMNIDVPQDAFVPSPAPMITETSAIEKATAPAATEDETKKRTRRTKEQLQADRQKLVATCVAAGIDQTVASTAIMTPEKQGDAEKAAQVLLDGLKGTPTSAPAKVTVAAMDTAALVASAPKAPSFATGPAPTVQDLKASIRDNASAPVPVTPVAAPVALAAQGAVAASASAIGGVGHVGPAPTPTAPPQTSAMAASLLDSLLSTTGQKT